MVETGAQLKIPAPWSFSNSLVLLFPCFFFPSPLWALEVPQMGQKKKGRIVPQAWGGGERIAKEEGDHLPEGPRAMATLGVCSQGASASARHCHRGLHLPARIHRAVQIFTVEPWQDTEASNRPRGTDKKQENKPEKENSCSHREGRPMADTLSPIGLKLSPMHGRTHTHTHSHKWLQQLRIIAWNLTHSPRPGRSHCVPLLP